MKQYVSEGTICVIGAVAVPYAVCDIKYTLWEDDSFEYEFTPNYSVISLLDSRHFQGIPGLDLDSRKEHFVRKNVTPVFISERVPQKNREDYLELLSEAGLDFMDPIRYLINTKLRYFGDGFFMTPKVEKCILCIGEKAVRKNNSALMKDALASLCLGFEVKFGDITIDDSTRKLAYEMLLTLYSRSAEFKNQNRIQGIELAKRNGTYKGRKRIPFDETKFRTLVQQVDGGKISAREAALQLNIGIDKFYREKRLLQRQ